MNLTELREILRAAVSKAGPIFAGLGIIVSDDLSALPVLTLAGGWQDDSAPLADALARISTYESPFHDGFHVMGSNGELRAVSQYFSPPIRPDLWKPSSQLHGGRYAAALFGSVLPSVVLTAAVSTRYGIAMFVDGKEIA